MIKVHTDSCSLQAVQWRHDNNMESLYLPDLLSDYFLDNDIDSVKLEERGGDMIDSLSDGDLLLLESELCTTEEGVNITEHGGHIQHGVINFSISKGRGSCNSPLLINIQ